MYLMFALRLYKTRGYFAPGQYVYKKNALNTFLQVREQNNMIQPHLYEYVTPLPIESFCCGRSVDDDDEFTPLSVVSLIFYALRRYLQTDIRYKGNKSCPGDSSAALYTVGEITERRPQRYIFLNKYTIRLLIFFWVHENTIYRIYIHNTYLLYKYTFAYFIEYNF